MKFQSHVPDFVDAPPAIALREFKDIEELLVDPWIMRWRETAGFPQDFQFYWSANSGRWSKCILMCQWTMESGLKKWWVLGYMDEIPESLPEWEPPLDDSSYDDED